MKNSLVLTCSKQFMMQPSVFVSLFFFFCETNVHLGSQMSGKHTSNQHTNLVDTYIHDTN